MSTVTFLGCDLVTGQIVEELPDLVPSGPLSCLLAAYTSCAFNLPIPLGGAGAAAQNWLGATEGGRAMIVAVVGGQPVWAGAVLTRTGGTAATEALAGVSLEGYLDRRYVAAHTYIGVDESSVIAAGLIGDANVEGLGFTVDAPATGTARDRTYADQDDKTVYSALRELMGVEDGPEWTIRLGWATAGQTAVSKTIMVRKRIGYATATPNAVFSTGKADTTYTLVEDYTAGRGANHVVATSSGEGDARPQSAPARDTDSIAAGWPRWELRYSPSSSITNQATLDAHARDTLALTRRGARVLTLTARADVYPMLGTDWSVGDDIGYDVTGHRHPNGLVGVARAVGWELDPRAGTVSPILLAPGTEGT